MDEQQTAVGTVSTVGLFHKMWVIYGLDEFEEWLSDQEGFCFMD
jgi:hypothetical protein